MRAFPTQDTEVLHGLGVTHLLRTMVDLFYAGNVPIAPLRNRPREGFHRRVIRRNEVSSTQHDKKNPIPFLRNAGCLMPQEIQYIVPRPIFGTPRPPGYLHQPSRALKRNRTLVMLKA
jgi:hypothetical protein